MLNLHGRLTIMQILLDGVKVERIEIKELKKRVMKEFKSSKCIHLILTGSIGIGKTTLLNAITADFDSISGIRSRLDIKEDLSRDIVLSEMGSDKIHRVARFGGERMEVVDDFFNTTGCEILKKHLENGHEYFLIDEVGPIDGSSMSYMNLLEKIFDSKKVFAVMKKSASALHSILENRSDYLVIDLDDYYDDIPYDDLIHKRITGGFD